VRIIELDGGCLCKISPIGVQIFMAPDNIADRACNEKIVLHQTQLLTLFRQVVGAKDFGDGFRIDLIIDGLDVIAAIEFFDAEFFVGMGFPQAEEVDGFCAVADGSYVLRWKRGNHRSIDIFLTQSPISSNLNRESTKVKLNDHRSIILVIIFEFESICGICFAFHLHSRHECATVSAKS
jgi:hypothetical protein